MLHRDKKKLQYQSGDHFMKKKKERYSLPDYRLPVFASSLGLLLLGYSS